MKNFLDWMWVTFLAIAIATHVMKIVYLLFSEKLKFLAKYEIISNRNLTNKQLILYYIVTITFLADIILTKINK